MVLTAPDLLGRLMEAPLRAEGAYFRWTFRALGTGNEILYRAPTWAAAQQYRATAAQWLADFEGTYSRFLESSLISQINRQAGQDWTEIDARTQEIFTLCDWFHWKTQGVFDPTMGPLVRLWDYHVKHAAPPREDEVQAARQLVGWSRVERAPGRVRLPQAGMSIDLGGIGKEWAVDALAKLADQAGLQHYCVDLGHDLRLRGEPPQGGPWRVGLEDPDSTGHCWGGVHLTDCGFCCSGDYQRYFECGGKRYGHIVDPRTGYPVQNGCRATWVVAPSSTEAGLLSTCSFILGAQEGLRLIEDTYQAAGCIWTDAGAHLSRRFHRYVIS